MVLVASSAVASAYTLVMRSGRRVEIPNQFVVSSENLTYEVGQGIQVSVQLVSIDIRATERANNELPGSFAKRVNQPPAEQAQAATPPKQTARRVITNRDLESYRSRRIQSENAYEKRRQALGLPTVEESRQRAALESQQVRAEVRERLAEDKNAEQYWRGRASSLRAEMISTDAQIQYVRNRLSEIPEDTNPYLFGSPNVFPYGYDSPYYGRNYPYQQPNIWSTQTYGSQTTIINPGRQGRINNGGRRYGRYGGYGSQYPYGVYAPYQSYDRSYERSELTSQLDQLIRRRISLDVQWRQLEEDARRAGAYPGWLRP
jgi:hypothetical protein